ncbi:MAG: T9SS type A sorting domain-containing protein [Chitinophagales bacterium]|nr:T9SS type A sorting domain-containing protein [Chitinophagales bacterium]
MRTYLLILSLLLMHCFANAQKIHFTDTSNVWTESFYHPDYTSVNRIYNGNYNTINGLTYVSGYELRREDTLQNKIYLKYNDTDDTTEHLLYDYNLSIGDSFTSIAYSNLIPRDTFIYSVTQLDSVKINNIWHKVWTFMNVYASNIPLYYYPPYTVIEGIGCTSGLNRPLMPGIFEGMRYILCFENNGNIITVPKPSGGYYLNAQTCALSVINNTDRKTITISPNPANQYSKITLPYTIQSGRLTITDVLGKTICSKSITNKTEIAIGEMPTSGVYFYMLTDSSGNKFAGRFVYQ